MVRVDTYLQSDLLVSEQLNLRTHNYHILAGYLGNIYSPGALDFGSIFSF